MKEYLREKPFFLSREQIAFVEQKLEQMTLEEKIGQLFLPINYIEDEQELREFVRKFQPAGLMNRPAQGKVNQNRHRMMQEESKIPMLIPANIESGGNGIAVEGTAFGNPLQEICLIKRFIILNMDTIYLHTQRCRLIDSTLLHLISQFSTTIYNYSVLHL